MDNGPSYPPAQGQIVRRVARERPGTVIIADCSLSMAERDGRPSASEPYGTGARRIERLAKVLEYVLTRVRLQALVCFGDVPEEVVLEGRVWLPEPDGGTALHLALEYVRGFALRPVRVVVLTDGHPNDADLALEEALKLRPVVIDAYFIGSDEDQKALDFLRELSKMGGPGGKWGKFDLSDVMLVGETIRLRIAGPKP